MADWHRCAGCCVAQRGAAGRPRRPQRFGCCYAGLQSQGAANSRLERHLLSKLIVVVYSSCCAAVRPPHYRRSVHPLRPAGRKASPETTTKGSRPCSVWATDDGKRAQGRAGGGAMWAGRAGSPQRVSWTPERSGGKRVRKRSASRSASCLYYKQHASLSKRNYTKLHIQRSRFDLGI